MSNPLASERQRVSFNPQDLSLYIYEGQENFNKIMAAYKILSEDPALCNDPINNGKGRIDLVKLSAKRTLRFQQVLNFTETQNLVDIWNHFDNQPACSGNPYLFIPCLRILGSDEQIKKFLEPSLRMEIIGAYAQTELGHGSDVRSLETTATFDSKTGEFVINTPTLTATKWWPAELGLTANHCLCFAQCIIDGKNYGVQAFIVPIRDLETNKTLPGIKAGDIGSKFGYDTKDNGFLSFDHVRIPRENMLSRYAEVTKEGKFVKRGHEKIGYAAMMQSRCAIVVSCWKALSQALTIGVRYSLVRTQFPDETGTERKIMEYQLQQEKLITNLALCFAMHAGSCTLRELAEINIKQVQEKHDFSMLGDVHALISATKAIYSWEALDAINIVRMSCGGHGFASYSGFTSIYREAATNPTYEGENTVMVLQMSRYLIKCLGLIKKGKKIPQFVEYLSDLNKFASGKPSASVSAPEDLTLDVLLEILRANAAVSVLTAANVLIEGAKDGGLKNSWDKKAGLDLQEATRAHTFYYTFKAFKDKITKERMSENVRKVLEKLCGLYALDKIIHYPQALFESGNMNGEMFKLIKKRKYLLMEELRPEAIGLVDAFNYTDNTLNSALGGYDGKVYETMWDWVNNRNEFNKTDWSETWKNYIKELRNVKRPKPML